MKETDADSEASAPAKKRTRRISDAKAKERGSKVSAARTRGKLEKVTRAKIALGEFGALLKTAFDEMLFKVSELESRAAAIENDIARICASVVGELGIHEAVQQTAEARESLYRDPLFSRAMQDAFVLSVNLVRRDLSVTTDGAQENGVSAEKDVKEVEPKSTASLGPLPEAAIEKSKANNPQRFFNWIDSRRVALSGEPEADKTVRLTFPDVEIPLIEVAGAFQEGRYESGVLVSAHAARPYNNEPVRMFIGVPGGGKTHAAMEFLGRTPGRITALAATIGADKQIMDLAGKLGLRDRVTVVDKPSRLRGEKRVLLDEAGRMDAKALEYLDACEMLAVSGDIGQTRASRGESVLGVLAALGAPIEVRETSRRTGDPSIRLLGSFVSSQYAAEITTNERVPFARSSIMRSEIASPGEGAIDAIVREVERFPSSVVVVWNQEMVAALKERGIVAYEGDEAQGVEADVAIVHLPLSWGNRVQYPRLPSVSLINAMCRARKRAILMSEFRMSDMGASLKGDNSRWTEIDRLIRLVSSDPRRNRQVDIHPFTHDHWRFVDALDNVLGRRARMVDVVGESLLICSSRAPKSYQAALVLRPTRFGISTESFSKAGFPYVFEFDLEEVMPICSSFRELEAWITERLTPVFEKNFDAEIELASGRSDLRERVVDIAGVRSN